MTIDPAEISSLRALWANVIQQVVLETWEDLRTFRAAHHAPRRASILASFEHYLNSRDFQHVCALAGIEHGAGLVAGMMRLATAEKRPAFFENGRALMGEAVE